MTKEEANYVNDLIVRCYSGGNKYADMFSKDSMTIGEVQLLVLFAMEEFKKELEKDLDTVYGKAKSKYRYGYPFHHKYDENWYTHDQKQTTPDEGTTELNDRKQ